MNLLPATCGWDAAGDFAAGPDADADVIPDTDDDEQQCGSCSDFSAPLTQFAVRGVRGVRILCSLQDRADK